MTAQRLRKKPSSDSDMVAIWTKIIDVQQHFNDVKSKNQTLFVSIITASMVATGYLSQHIPEWHTAPVLLSLCFCNIVANYYTLPIVGALIFTAAFYVLDYGVYQTLLKGAVECGKEFETKVMGYRLTSNIIEDYSSEDYLIDFKVFGIEVKWIKGSGTKQRWFYGLIGLGLFALLFLLNLQFVKCPLLPSTT